MNAKPNFALAILRACPAFPLVAALVCVCLWGCLTTSSAHADNFVFDVEYLGNDMTNLALGSDDPDGQSLEPGDTFQWTIAAQDTHVWDVETAGGFFPLMAFSVNPAGSRIGDFTLALRNNGADVFNLSETAVQTQEVHLGTNTVDLPAGLQFDEMFLDYALTSATEVNPPQDPVTTTLSGRLPIFGAPENNTFSPGIAYVLVPEPGALGLLACTCFCSLVTHRRMALR